MESARGQLLIAGPTLLDPNFQRTVVLMIEHSPEGALGLVLNRPSESYVSEVASELEELFTADSQVFIGGPVHPGGLIVLARFREPEGAAVLSFQDVGILRAELPVDDPPDLLAVRAFAGHAGWGPGQLEDELERGDWILEPALVGDAFTEAPEDLWSTVLSRKGGSYALVARMPPDPSVN
jgi:putative transcriptional regulator